MGGHEVWQKPIGKRQKAEQFIVAAIQSGEGSEAEIKRNAREAGITHATFENALSDLKSNNLVVANQHPTRQGNHNILELPPDNNG